MPATKPYRVYFPQVNGPRPPFYGLAWANQPDSDLPLLGAEWFYVWSCQALQRQGLVSVPMLKATQAPALPADYAGPLLVFNEPNVAIQDNLSPSRGVALYREFMSRLPKAQPVVGNVSIFATDWLRDFVRQEPLTRVGVHCYLEAWVSLEYVSRELDRLYADLKLPVWVTEFNNLSPDAAVFSSLLRLLESKPYVERVAPFTNRQLGDWWDLPECSLVSPAGELLPKGRAYLEGRRRGNAFAQM